ncbi:MAG: hypothetical protein ACE5I7_00230 [Candidatus Binatia bacterium]
MMSRSAAPAVGCNAPNPGTNAGRGLAAAAVSLCVVAALGAGCGLPHGNRQPNTLAASVQRRSLVSGADRVLVLPLRDGSFLPANGDHVMCHLTGEQLPAGQVPHGAGTQFAAVLFRGLQRRGVDLVPFEQGSQLVSAADPVLRDRYQPSLAVTLGKKGGASKVIMGVVTCYEEFSGSRFGSRQPANVAFSLALVDVSTGALTHKFIFSRRQVPLMSNLLALPIWWREGFQWWPRRQVAEEALTEAADKLVGLHRPASFLAGVPVLPAAQEGSEWRAKPLAAY